MRKVTFAALFVLPVLFLLSWLGEFPFQPASSYSDLAVSHLPNAIYLRESLLRWGEVPLWSTAILSGYPFAANPLSGLFYLPGWLALVFPLPLGFNLLVVLHLIFGGVGMLLFLRSLGLSDWSALFGGLAFEALPKLYSHLGAGHITLIYAIAWTPWLLLAEQRLYRSDRMHWVLSGAILGIIALADVRWLAYAGLLWIAFSFSTQLSAAGHARWPGWLASRLSNAVIAALVAAPLLLPLAQYTSLSTREQLIPTENFTLSLPPGQLFSLIYPAIGGSAEWVLYPGAVTFALTLFAFSHKPVRRRCAVWLVMILVTLVYALGSNIPYLELLASLPGFDLLRVPPRMLFLTGFCIAVTAGFALDDLVAVVSGKEQVGSGWPVLVLFAVTAFAVLFALAIWAAVDVPLTRIQFSWGALFMLAGTAAIMLGLNRRISAGTMALIITTACLIDLISVNRLSLSFRSPEEVFAQGREAVELINQDAKGEAVRVYSPSYSIPQHVAARYGLELADGVDPLQLSTYVAYMQKASGVPSVGYSVTLPTFAGGNPRVDNQNFTPDARLLGLLNVGYVTAAFPLNVDGLVQIAEFDGTFVYKNTLALPRAWVQLPEAAPGEGEVIPVAVTMTPNTIRIEAVQGPGLLVLSEVIYPGWQAVVDGQSVEIEPVGGLFRGVRLGEGQHTVEMVFRPMLVYLGLAIAGAAWLFLILWAWAWPWSKQVSAYRQDV